MDRKEASLNKVYEDDEVGSSDQKVSVEVSLENVETDETKKLTKKLTPVQADKEANEKEEKQNEKLTSVEADKEAKEKEQKQNEKNNSGRVPPRMARLNGKKIKGVGVKVGKRAD